MIAPEFKRICGIHMQEQGEIGAIWLAHDKTTDIVHLYDACKFRNEVWPVITEGMNARGRWIPVAWTQGEVKGELSKRGIKTLWEPVSDIPEMVSRDIQERMRTGRFKVDKRLGEWLEEFKTFYKEDSKVPVAGFPLMTATRVAMSDLKRAKRQGSPRARQVNYPQVAIL